MSADSREMGWTRREALGMLGMGVAAAALPAGASAAPTFPKGAVIRTVLKDYAPEALGGGATLFHEHLSLVPDFLPRWRQFALEAQAAHRPPNAPSPANQGGTPPAAPSPSGPYFMQDAELMAEEMAIATRDGISCIVDGGHADMGRDIGFLRQVSMRSGMPIVAGGGFYAQPFYPRELSAMSEDQIFRALLHEVEADPIGAFGEIGSWDYITKDERKVFRAIGRAHLATNIPIFTHTGIPGKSALEQLDILEDAGVDPARVVIGHLGNLVDPKIEVHRAICRRGAFVGFDRQGGPADDQVVPLVMSLIAEGYTDHLLFSSDFSSAAQLKRNNPALGYAKTLTVFVPKLKQAGATDDVLRQIMNDNPRRFLAFVPNISRKA
ncbi:MAG: amidohydrolase family protein [Acidobacteriota bacterium]|nr:amidohydrolase family protein [Acidobacteriota bacterium]